MQWENHLKILGKNVKDICISSSSICLFSLAFLENIAITKTYLLPFFFFSLGDSHVTHPA